MDSLFTSIVTFSLSYGSAGETIINNCPITVTIISTREERVVVLASNIGSNGAWKVYIGYGLQSLCSFNNSPHEIEQWNKVGICWDQENKTFYGFNN